MISCLPAPCPDLLPEKRIIDADKRTIYTFFELNTFSVKELQRAAAVERQQMWLCTHLKSQRAYSLSEMREGNTIVQGFDFKAMAWIWGECFFLSVRSSTFLFLKAPPFDRIGTAEGKNVRSATDVSFEGGLAKQNAV